jgi:CheY-like chemotaxis protein
MQVGGRAQVSAVDGAELAAGADQHPDVVLLDVVMPVMDGL